MFMLHDILHECCNLIKFIFAIISYISAFTRESMEHKWRTRLYDNGFVFLPINLSIIICQYTSIIYDKINLLTIQPVFEQKYV